MKCANIRFRSEADKRFKHGHAGRKKRSPEYITWVSIIRRCFDSKSKDYKSYGGRGISMDLAWRNSFQTFLSDMGPRPPSASIDRIDNNGDYTKDNCRWANKKAQMNNTRSNVRIKFNGKNKTISEWASEFGLKKGTLWLRLKKFSIEKAMTKELMKRGFKKGTKKFPNRNKKQETLKLAVLKESREMNG